VAYRRLPARFCQASSTKPALPGFIKSKDQLLDGVAGLHVASVPLVSRPILDLAGATLSDPHPNPGTAVTLSVPLRNLGLAPKTVKAQLLVKTGKRLLGRLKIHRRLGPLALSIVRMHFRAPAQSIILKASGMHATKRKELGLPLAPTELVVSPSQDGVTTLRWKPAHDHDIVEFRVYRASPKQFSLVGISSDATLVDPAVSGAVGPVKYAVTAVDTEGRESVLAHAVATGRAASRP